MGSGKTTIGKLLASKMNLQFIDLDLFIENRYRKKIKEIFAEKGEDEFRKIEQATLQEIASFENILISTGGGAPCFFDNMKLMNELGLTVYLKASPKELVNRLSSYQHNRPLIKDKSPEEMIIFVAENLNKRNIYYNQALIIFDFDQLNDSQDMDEIVDNLHKRLISINHER